MSQVEPEVLEIHASTQGSYASSESEARRGASLFRSRASAHRTSASASTSSTYPLVKRTLDIGLSLLAIMLGLPLFLLLAAIIKLDSRGSVLFSHQRIGRHGQRFQCLKFRTMVVNAEQSLADYLEANPELRRQWEEQHKLDRDPRLTCVGRVLRKFSLDELPQFWNVLKGDMSLIGPRPIVDEEIARYGDDFPIYTSVRPGISGLWQVSGRNDTSYPRRVRLDTYYASNQSLTLDLYILILTPRAVLLSRGAR